MSSASSHEINAELAAYLKPDARTTQSENGIAVDPIEKLTPGMRANAQFFSHSRWGPKYFAYENFSSVFAERWRRASGGWDGKIVVDVGCGPGNLARSVGGSPRLLIGVDISEGALLSAKRLGYTALLADAHRTPLISGFADLVAVNATLHHCDDMAAVLAEAARLVRPGGMLITDEDPLKSRQPPTGLGDRISRIRSMIPIARVRDHPERTWQYYSFREQRLRAMTELHKRFPGDGIAPEVFGEVLHRLGFSIRVLPHNHVAGADLVESGDRGESSVTARVAQRLSSLESPTDSSSLSVMCIATRPSG